MSTRIQAAATLPKAIRFTADVRRENAIGSSDAVSAA
jgi:hypothetical protein